jgi:transcriptional regulator with XRE-family HTH domain
MKDSIQEIAIGLKAARKKSGLSQRALSSKIGIPQGHISKIEQGEVDLQTSSLIQIARALRLEVVLVPLGYLSAVQALQAAPRKTSKPIPAYRLSDEEEENEDV